MNNRWTDAGSCSFYKDKLNLHSVSWDVAGSRAVLSSSGYHLQMDHQCWDALGPAPQENGCGLMLPPIPYKIISSSHSVCCRTRRKLTLKSDPRVQPGSTLSLCHLKLSQNRVRAWRAHISFLKSFWPEVGFKLTIVGTGICKKRLPWWSSGKDSACQCRGQGFDA